MIKTSEIKINWKGKKSIPSYLFLIYYAFVISIYLKKGISNEIQKPTFWIITVAWILLEFLCVLEINTVRDFIKRHSKWFSWVLLILVPGISFLMVEIMVSNLNLKMFKAYTLYNLVWYMLIYYLIFALTRSARVTVISGNFLIYMASMVNYLVYLFRGNPILPSDLLAWKTGMSVASSYDLSFTEGFLISTIIMFLVFVLGYKLESDNRGPSLINRLVVLATFAVFFLFVFNTFFETDLIKKKIRVLDFFAPKYTYSSYGTAFGFVANVKAMEADQPEGYSTEKVNAILEEAEKGTEQAVNGETIEVAARDEKPNIIVIMNEAFSDLSMLGDFETNMEYLPYTSTLEENTTKGALYVSVFGGATSDTEYEFLTGNSMAVMPRDCVPYQQFVTDPTDSLATTLKDQGYYNIAIHPYEPSGYKRDMVYPLLGFDEFISKEDFVNPTLIRSFISDRESYKKIIEQYEAKGGDNPLFIFNVTMQNHGGYSNSPVFDEANTVRLTDNRGYGYVEQYLSLLRESDLAFQTLVDYFSAQKEHTIILLFGDHQPVAYAGLHDSLAEQEGITMTEALERKYKVPFILWANYDIKEDDVDKISANYLSSYLLKTAGLKGTSYNQYLLDLYEEVPVINALFYIDKKDGIHYFSEENQYSKLIQDYRCVGYNDAFEKKNKRKEYYRIRED